MAAGGTTELVLMVWTAVLRGGANSEVYGAILGSDSEEFCKTN